MTWATSFSLETSRCQYSAMPPLSLICCTTFFPFSSRRSVRATFAPSCASSLQTALPIPPAAPVTIATFPLTLSKPHLPFDSPTPHVEDGSHLGYEWPA